MKTKFLSLTAPVELQEVPSWLTSIPFHGGWHEYIVGDHSEITDGEFDPAMDLIDFLYAIGFHNVHWIE